MRCATIITYAGRRIRVEFSPLPPDYDVGIMGWGSEDHTLHDPETEDRLEALEDGLNSSDWDDIADLVNTTFDFDIEDDYGSFQEEF